MNLTISFNLDNAAFCDVPYKETSRILSKLAEDMQKYCQIRPQSIMDYNGNTIGNLEITE